MDTELEIQVIKKFIRKEKQKRYIGFVSSSKNRKKFIAELAHFKDLSWDLFQEVSDFNPSLISPKLVRDFCYVISEDTSADGSVIPLEKIPSVIGNGFGMIIVFGQGDQIYYEGEPPYNRYMSKYL